MKLVFELDKRQMERLLKQALIPPYPAPGRKRLEEVVHVVYTHEKLDVRQSSRVEGNLFTYEGTRNCFMRSGHAQLLLDSLYIPWTGSIQDRVYGYKILKSQLISYETKHKDWEFYETPDDKTDQAWLRMDASNTESLMEWVRVALENPEPLAIFDRRYNRKDYDRMVVIADVFKKTTSELAQSYGTDNVKLINQLAANLEREYLSLAEGNWIDELDFLIRRLKRTLNKQLKLAAQRKVKRHG